MSINCQVNLAGIASSTFSYGLIVAAGSACTVLVSLGIAAINEHPFHVGLRHKLLENLEPFSSCGPHIEAFIDLIPVPERFGEVSLGASRAHALQHALHGHS